MTSKRTFFPATGWDWALPIYDPLANLLGVKAICSELIELLELAAGERFLDIGCGTGTLLVLIRQFHPSVSVVGLDPDPKALARAAGKARRAGVEVHLDRGFADQLPYADASFDRVFCNILSLLPRQEKDTMLAEVRRVLRPGGRFHLWDALRKPPGFSFWRMFERTAQFEFSTEEQILALMRKAGLSRVRKTEQRKVWLWSFAGYQATR